MKLAAADKVLDVVHGGALFRRRVRTLSEHLSALIPRDATVLDVGSGDGSLAMLLMKARPDIRITGIDTLVRPQTAMTILPFNGRDLGFDDATFDVVMFVDVLHHAADPLRLLQEAARVSRRDVVIKDHLRAGILAFSTLRFMDYVGNARHGVSLPYHYFRMKQWNEAFEGAGLRVDTWKRELNLYPWPANFVFGRSLHFVARLNRVQTVGAGAEESCKREQTNALNE